MADQWKLSVDPRRCVRTGLCVATAPERFGFDENGRSSAPGEAVPASDALFEVAESCPTEAISIVDVETGESVFPPDD
jgi:ferredoxin